MDDLRTQVANAIRMVQRKLLWKPGSGNQHLQKRKRRGHLSYDATIVDYEQIIHTVVSDRSATVYIYHHSDIPYVTVVATVESQIWLVMFGMDGVLESAYVLDRAELYLSKPVFEQLGKLERILS